MKKSKRLKVHDYCIYILIYLIISSIIIQLIAISFKQDGKTLIWSVDGVPQYILWMKYTGTYLRDILSSILHGNFTLKMYDFHIGMGGDVRTFFKTEIFQFFSIFYTDSSETTEMYNLMSILRVMLAGITFSAYGFYMEKKQPEVLAGALTYIFSGYTFHLIERHPQFAVSLIMLPLLMIGLEQVLRQNNPLFYSFAVAVTLCCSYYFLYMITIMMGFYVLLRIRTIYPKNTLKEFFAAFLRIVFSYLLGCGMACFAFLPTISRYTASSRVTIKSGLSSVSSPWYYEIARLPKLLFFAIQPISAPYVTPISVSLISVPALCMVFGGKIKEKIALKTAFFIELLFLMVPLGAYIMSGFSAVNNRWVFGYSFLIGIIVMTEFHEFSRINLRQFLLMVASILVIFYVYFTYFGQSPYKSYYLYSIIAFIAVVLLIGFMRIRKAPKFIWSIVLLLIVVISVAWNGYSMNSSRFFNISSQFVAEDGVEDLFESSKFSAFANIEDDSFYRCDSIIAKNNNLNNVAVALDYNGISLYNSTINGNEITSLLELENSGLSATNRIITLDGSTALEELACVKYYLSRTNNDHAAPYGFELNESLSSGSKNLGIYENKYTLPIGYTYSSFITRSEYSELSALEKQQAQLQTAIIEDEDTDMCSSIQEKQSFYSDISQGDNASLIKAESSIEKLEGNNTYRYTDSPDGTKLEEQDCPKFSLKCRAKAGCEVYLHFKNLNAQPDSDLDTRTAMRVHYGKNTKWINVRTIDDPYGLGRTDYLLNLGYYKKGQNIDFTLQFDQSGIVSWDDIEVYYVSMDHYENEVDALRDGALTNVKISTNTVSGQAESSSDQIMVYSIPYSSGWTAYVDGKKTKVCKANAMYLGIFLPAGSHSIVLKYVTPGIKAGFIISTISTLLFMLFLITWIRNLISRRRLRERRRRQHIERMKRYQNRK